MSRQGESTMSISHLLDEDRSSAVGGREIAAARAFYCDALGGRQVRPAGLADTDGRLWFRVNGALVEAGSALHGPHTRVALSADDPAGLAERCWDAGFEVRVHDDATGRTLFSVVDPFGRQIDLIPNGTGEPAMRAGAERR